MDGKVCYLEDPAAAADVFLFADDQLVDLVKADALYEVTRNTDAIIAANTPGSINAASYEGTLDDIIKRQIFAFRVSLLQFSWECAIFNAENR